MKPEPCHICGANLNVVGTRHRCVPRQANVANADHVANGMANNRTADVANGPSKPAGLNRASTTYRYRSPDKRRLYMRNLMRQRRATGRAA